MLQSLSSETHLANILLHKPFLCWDIKCHKMVECAIICNVTLAVFRLSFVVFMHIKLWQRDHNNCTIYYFKSSDYVCTFKCFTRVTLQIIQQSNTKITWLRPLYLSNSVLSYADGGIVKKVQCLLCNFSYFSR